MSSNIYLNVYSSLHAEVAHICKNIKMFSNESLNTAIIITEPDSVFHTAICSELQYQNIFFQDYVINQRANNNIGITWKNVLIDWTRWQITRDIFSFSNFCDDLNSIAKISDDQIWELNKNLNHLSATYLTKNYDIISLKLPPELKSIFDQYDINSKIINLSNFLKSYEHIWGTQYIKLIKEHFSPYDQNIEFSREILLKNLFSFLTSSEISFQKDCKNFVSILPMQMVLHNVYDQIFCSLSNYDIINKQVLKFLLKKQGLNLSCCKNNQESCLSNLNKITENNIFIQKHTDFKLPKLEPVANRDILQTKIAYDSRQNPDAKFDEYSYMLDSRNLAYLPCKIVEIFLKKPDKFFYENVLQNCNFNKLGISELKKIFIGSVVHELLNISPDRCRKLPTINEFYKCIDQKLKNLYRQIKTVYDSANIDINYHIREALNFSKYTAYKLANKILLLGYHYIGTEIVLPKNRHVVFDQRSIKLTGRIDCILSNQPFSITSPNNTTLNIFDFKTGTYDFLNLDKFSEQLKNYTGIQILLYGLALRNLGFNHVNIQILHPDKETTAPINIDTLVPLSEPFLKKMSNVLDERILGENIKSFTENLSYLPLAESTRTNAIILKKICFSI